MSLRMGGLDGEEVDIRGGTSLVVVADLEVAGGPIELVGAEGLGSAAVQADLEHVVLIGDGVAELLATGMLPTGLRISLPPAVVCSAPRVMLPSPS